MSGSNIEDSPGLPPLHNGGTASLGIWCSSCLLHLLLLWGLSTFSIARGVGGSGGGGGPMIEGRFLGGSEGETGEGDADSDGLGEASSSPALRLVSATPETDQSHETVEDAAAPEEIDDPPEEVATPEPARRSQTLSRDSTEIESDTRAAPRQARAVSAVDDAKGRAAFDRAPGGREVARGGAGDGYGVGGSGTTFFEIAGRGTRFVFVIDRSESMQHKRRFDAARTELRASLQELAESSFVQILFYNDDVVAMSAGERPSLLRNTPVHQRKLAQFAAGVQPDGGTDHLRALQLALQLAPDAIFLLTDADEPKLHAADLDQLLRTNRRRVPIHAVELGIGPLLERDNFLMRLARQNRGSYRYWNIEELSNDTADRRSANGDR